VDVANKVTEILGRYASAQRPLELDDRLEELKIDSLGLMELLFDLEEAFGIRIELNANRMAEHRQDWLDVRSAIRTVERLIAQRELPHAS
jgi:acyl carrier protein